MNGEQMDRLVAGWVDKQSMNKRQNEYEVWLMKQRNENIDGMIEWKERENQLMTIIKTILVEWQLDQQ